jgi:hypothetical protein
MFSSAEVYLANDGFLLRFLAEVCISSKGGQNSGDSRFDR